MSKVVDSVEITDGGRKVGGRKVEKKITINLGDGVAREQSAKAVKVAEEAKAFAGTGVTDNSDVNAIILACSCYGYAGIPVDISAVVEWFSLYIGSGDNGVSDIEIVHNGSNERYTLVDGYNELFWEYFGCYMRIYVSYRNAQQSWTDAYSFVFTNVVARSTSYALLEALKKGGNILKIEGAPIDYATLNNVFLACYVESPDCYGLPIDISHKRWSVFDNDFDEDGYPINLLLIDNETGRQIVIYNGYNSFSLDEDTNSPVLYLYADIDFLAENDLSVDGTSFYFTNTTMESSQYSLIRAFERLASTENQAEEAKEMADDTMIDTDDTYYHYAQVLIRDANGNKVDADTLNNISIKRTGVHLEVNGLHNYDCIYNRYFKARSPEGLRISGYIPDEFAGGTNPKRFVPTMKSIDPQANVALVMYEDTSDKIERCKQVEQAQNNIMCNYIMRGIKPTMVYREVGDMHYTVDYNKKWADDKNLFKGSSGGTWKTLQDVLLLDCTGMTSLQNAFTVSGGYSTRNLRSVCGICNFEGVTSFKQMFYDAGHNLETIQFAPQTVVKNKVDISSMFASLRSIKGVNIDEIVFEGGVTEATFMFADCFKLEKVKFPAMPGLTKCTYMFSQCWELRSIDATNLDFSTITGFDLMGLWKLEELKGLNGIKQSYSIGNSPLLTYESAIDCINGLYDLTEGGTEEDYTPQTLTLHENVFAQLYVEDIAVAVEKGWSVVEY